MLNMRYVPLGLGAVAVLALVGAAYGVVETAMRPLASGPPALPPLPALDAQARTALGQVEAVAAAQQRWQTAAQQPVVGHEQASPLIAQAVPGTDAPESPTMPKRHLVLVVHHEGAGMATALLDGRFVRVGERLEQGAQVLRIESDRVELAERLGRQTVTLPRDAVRVGTLRWPNGQYASVATRHYTGQRNDDGAGSPR